MPKKIIGEPFSLSLISGIEKFYASEGYITFFDFLSKFFFSNAEKVRRETILCSRKILVSKIVRDKRRGKYHNFPSNFFCLTVPKIFVGESFSVSFISAIKKFWIGGEREYRDFRRFFCLTVTKIFIGGHFGVSEKFFIEKFHA